MWQFSEIDMVRTGQNIVQLREKSGLSVKDIQEIMGFSTPQTIYKWQNGNSLPTIDNLVVLSQILRTSVDEILVLRQSGSMRLGA
jgi:transcriptional regulator with XRE-family HTH domain